jgi:hypothetical protein
MEEWNTGMMGLNPNGVIERHGDGEKKIILLRVPESPFLRVFFSTSPIFHYSNIPCLSIRRPAASSSLIG